METLLFNEWNNSDLKEDERTLLNAFIAGYSCGARWENDHWHNITQDLRTLPKKVANGKSRLCVIVRKNKLNNKYIYDLGRYDHNQQEWIKPNNDYTFNVTAWIYFPVFQENKTENQTL